MTKPKSVVIDGIEFVAEDVPPSASSARPPEQTIAGRALRAMDQLGTDSVRVAVGVSAGFAVNPNQGSKRHGIPVRFVCRNTRSEGGRRVCDVFAIRVKGGDQ